MRVCSRIRGLCTIGLPLVLCGVADAQHAADAWAAPDELLDAQNLSKLVADNQKYAIAAGVLILGLLLGIAYLVPIIRWPRWQLVAFAIVPVLVALGTMAVLSRPIEPRVEGIPYEEMRKVVDSEVALPGDKLVADRILKWQGELQARSFLVDVSSMPMAATFAASVALIALLWFTSHYRVLRGN